MVKTFSGFVFALFEQYESASFAQGAIATTAAEAWGAICDNRHQLSLTSYPTRETRYFTSNQTRASDPGRNFRRILRGSTSLFYSGG